MWSGCRLRTEHARRAHRDYLTVDGTRERADHSLLATCPRPSEVCGQWIGSVIFLGPQRSGGVGWECCSPRELTKGLRQEGVRSEGHESRG